VSEFSGPFDRWDRPPSAFNPAGPGLELHSGRKSGGSNYLGLCFDANSGRLSIGPVQSETIIRYRRSGIHRAFSYIRSGGYLLAGIGQSDPFRFFRALLFTPGMALLTNWFPSNRRATATGLYLVGGMSGSVIFNIAGPLIVALSDWRVAFISVASLGIIASLILLKFGKESPTQPARRKESILEAFKLFRYRIMWICGGLQFVRFATMQGITYWLPSLLMNENVIPLRYAGFIIAAQAILVAPSNILGGYVSDRLKNPILVITVSLIVLGITAMLLVSVHNIALLILVIVINAIFLQMYFGPLFSIPVEILGVRKAGIATGFSNFFANIGAFSATYLLGWLKDTTGMFKYGFYTIAGLCFVGLILAFTLSTMRRSPAILGAT
jgi:nitrate/nitrite transporter NarK